MRKKIILILTLVLLCACSKRESSHLLIFYSNTCPSCQALQDSFLDKISNLELEIELYDIDQDENESYYQEILGQLEDVDESLKQDPMVPFIVFDKQFAIVGYSFDVEELYLRLIHDALNNELSKNELPSGCWGFKEE